MKNNASDAVRRKESSNCPFIGIKGEPDSFFGYASASNYCFHASPPGSVKLSHQEKYCLSGSFRECEIFFSSGLEPLPDSIQCTVKTRKPVSSQEIIRFGLPSLIALGVIVLFLFLIFRRPLYGDSSAIPNTSTSPVIIASNTVSPTISNQTGANAHETGDLVLGIFQETTSSLNQIPTSTPEPTGTFTPTATFTPDFTPGPGLETPFGPENSYILHAVAEGESYPKLAQIFDTTAEVLKAINLIPGDIGLRTGIVIVVIPGEKDIQDLPGFITILVDQATSVEDIALEYRISPDEIIYYNQINPQKNLPVGRYLIIPLRSDLP